MLINLVKYTALICHVTQHNCKLIFLLYLAIQREEMKVKKSLQDAAKKGDHDVCKILAKEIIRARKSINRIHTTKAQINSVQMSMNHTLGKNNFFICYMIFL